MAWLDNISVRQAPYIHNKTRCQYDENGEFHGEIIIYGSDESSKNKPLWHTYDVHGEEIHDFLENPLTDVERMLLLLKYGAPLLPRLDNDGV